MVWSAKRGGAQKNKGTILVQAHQWGGELGRLDMEFEDDNKTYSGVTNSYFAKIILKGINATDTGRQRLDILSEYIRQKGTISPVYDSRRIVK